MHCLAIFFILLNSIHCLVFFHPPQFNTCLVIFHLLNLLNSAWSYSFSISSIRYSAWSFLNSIIYLVLFSSSPVQYSALSFSISSIRYSAWSFVFNLLNSIYCLVFFLLPTVMYIIKEIRYIVCSGQWWNEIWVDNEWWLVINWPFVHIFCIFFVCRLFWSGSLADRDWDLNDWRELARFWAIRCRWLDDCRKHIRRESNFVCQLFFMSFLFFF